MSGEERVKRAVLIGCLGFFVGCSMRTNPDAVGLDCDHGTHLCVGTLEITSPGNASRTTGMVTIQVAANPAKNPPAEVQIRRNQMPLATVRFPFTYVWDTHAETEGSYQIDAIADVGGRKVTARPVMVSVDRTPPSVERRMPAPDAANVALADPIHVTFRETLDPSTVSPAAISLSSAGSTLNTTASLGSDGKTINISFAAHPALSLPATITATVSPTVKDLAGNAVGALPSWSWSVPLWVRMPALSGGMPSLALDSTGRASLAYLATGNSNTTAGVLRYAPGATWEPDFGPPTTATATGVQLAMGNDGTPVLAWMADHIRVARWDGSRWNGIGGNVEVEANAPPAEDLSFLSSLQLGSSGATYVAWATSPCGGCNLGYVAGWSAAEGWHLLPTGTSAGPGGPALRVDGNGVVTGLFPGNRGSSPTLQRFSAGAWSNIESFAGGGLVIPGVAIDGQNRQVIMVHALDPAVEVLVFRAYRAPGLADLLTPSLATGSSGAVGTGQVVQASNGDVLALWTQYDTSSHVRLHVARFRGNVWDTTFGVLSGIPNGDAVNAVITTDAEGLPTVAWDEHDSSTGTDSVFVWKSNY